MKTANIVGQDGKGGLTARHNLSTYQSKCMECNPVQVSSLEEGTKSRKGKGQQGNDSVITVNIDLRNKSKKIGFFNSNLKLKLF